MNNKSVYKNLNLNSDEELLKIVQRSRWHLFLALLPALILIILPFFLLAPLFYWGTAGRVIFFVLLAVGLSILIKKIITWRGTALLITNQRLVDIDREKLFFKVVSDIPLTKIQDVFYQIKGLNQVISRTGNVQIILAETKTKIEIKDVSWPQRVQQLILQLKNEASKEVFNAAKLSADELIRLVEKIKAGIGEDKFREITKTEQNDPAAEN